MDLNAIYYVVESIDGDYANLRRKDDPQGEPKLVARAAAGRHYCRHEAEI